MPRRKRCDLCRRILGIRVWTVPETHGVYCRKCAQKLCAKNQVPIPLDKRKKS